MVFLLVIVFLLIGPHDTSAARSCDYRPVPACTCWNARRPTISCIDANLTHLPDIPIDYVHGIDLSLNNIEVGLNEKLGHAGLVLTKLILSNGFSDEQSGLPEECLTHVKNSLKWLDLSHNTKQLNVVPKVVKTLQKLEHLDLSYNSIQSIDEDDFLGLEGLQTVLLAGNYMDIHANTFRPLQNLQTISLSLNQNWHTPVYPKWLSKIKKLYLIGFHHANTLDRFFMAIQFSNLEELYIKNSYNYFGGIPFNIFNRLSSTLKVLSLTGNKIRSLPHFRVDLPQLQFLDLSNNSLSIVETQNLCLKRVKHIDLRNNNIENLSQVKILKLTSCFGKLEKLDLRNNRIQQLYSNMCYTWTSVKLKVLLTSIRCNCFVLGWALEIKRNNYTKFNSCVHPDNDALYCRFPSKHRGKTFWEFGATCPLPRYGWHHAS